LRAVICYLGGLTFALLLVWDRKGATVIRSRIKRPLRRYGLGEVGCTNNLLTQRVHVGTELGYSSPRGIEEVGLSRGGRGGSLRCWFSRCRRSFRCRSRSRSRGARGGSRGAGCRRTTSTTTTTTTSCWGRGRSCRRASWRGRGRCRLTRSWGRSRSCRR